MTEVFVDTSGFYACLNPEEKHHEDARRGFQAPWHLLTTNYVIHESVALVQARLGWAAVDGLLDVLIPLCEVVWVSESLHNLGIARCRQARSRRLSLTDCISFEVMRNRKVSQALAWDEHFSREGFLAPQL